MVTIGQTPRRDLVPELIENLGGLVEVTEFGALDGLDREQIAALAPVANEHRLVTRLADGSEAVVSKHWIHQRIEELVAELDERGFDAIVLLCTGTFDGLRPRPLLLEAQKVVDAMVAALSGSAQRIGVLVPDAAQMDEFHDIVGPRQVLKFSHASPYGNQRFSAAGRELADTDIIVMHCMGYSEAMRQTVAAASQRPVLLARRMVSAALQQLI